MQLAPVARAAPMRIAETLVAHFERPASIAEVSIAAPGFLNLRMDPAWVAAQVEPIRAAGVDYGRRAASEPRRINVEFVSANPTGPLTVGNARGAFVGDVLSRVLEAAGQQVTREYYFNDYNEQIRNLGLTVACRAARASPCRRTAITATTSPTSSPPCQKRSGRPPRHRTPIRARCSAAGRLNAFAPGSSRASSDSAFASTSGPARARSTPRAGSSAASPGCASQGSCTKTTARSGSGRPPSATTRIGSSSARTAAQPTSPPTSATWPRSSAVGSTS